jgi:fibronectin-binding autotransporter adhesin
VYNAELVLSSPVITLANYEASGRQTYNGVISGPGGLVQRGSGLTILSGANTYSGGTIPTTGNIGFGIDSVGSVTSGPIGTGPLLLAPEVPNLTGSGTVLAYGGARTIANPIQYPSATNNLTLIIGGTNKLTFTGSYTLNGNDFPNGTNNVRTLQVDNTGLTTISGVISDTTNGVSAGFSFIKSGTNTLALSNIETYTGPTTVSAGTLQVNGQLNASSVVTVRSNSTLSGTGTINGPITINAGGALAPGAASIGTLTVNNNLTLAGNVNVRVNRSGSTSDKASVSGTLSNSGTGTVVVTNTGAAFQVNDTFAVFNKAVTGGATMKVIGGGVGWSNQLAVNGMIVVSSTNPPTIGTSLSGLTLTLSWPPDYFGWVVQSNSVSLTSTNWFTVPNTGNATSYPITITSARTNVFYRLVQP